MWVGVSLVMDKDASVFEHVILHVGIIVSSNFFQFLRVYSVFISCASELGISVIASSMKYFDWSMNIGAKFFFTLLMCLPVRHPLSKRDCSIFTSWLIGAFNFFYVIVGLSLHFKFPRKLLKKVDFFNKKWLVAERPDFPSFFHV